MKLEQLQNICLSKGARVSVPSPVLYTAGL